MKAMRNSPTIDVRRLPSAAALEVACPECGATFPLTAALTQQARDQLRLEYEARREEDRAAIEAGLRQDLAGEVCELREQLDHKEAAIREFRQAELKLRRSQRTLTEALENSELEVERRVAGVTKEIEAQARKRADERYALKLAEKDQQLHATLAQLEEATRKAEQGSQERQGSVQHEALEHVLTSRFAADVVSSVGRGRPGADVVQQVRTEAGERCGTILWESKRARTWAATWIDKLKADQRRLGADLAVIVTATLPKGAERIDYVNGVWLCDLAGAPQLARVLRETLIALAQLRTTQAVRKDLMGQVYDYITGAGFAEHVKAMLESLIRMNGHLSDERAAVERLWAKRQNEIHLTVGHLARMVGDLQGFGAALPIPGLLELEATTEQTGG